MISLFTRQIIIAIGDGFATNNKVNVSMKSHASYFLR